MPLKLDQVTAAIRNGVNQTIADGNKQPVLVVRNGGGPRRRPDALWAVYSTDHVIEIRLGAELLVTIVLAQCDKAGRNRCRAYLIR